MSNDKQAKAHEFIVLLTEGTQGGWVEWENSYGGYQTTLGGLVLFLERNAPYSDPASPKAGMPGTAALEVRGKKGELIERIESLDPMQGALGVGSDPRYSSDVTDAVSNLYDLVINRKEVVAEAAIDNLLDALKGRVRAG